MINWLKNNKWLVVIFIVAAVFRLIIFFGLIVNYGPGSFYIDNDGQSLDGNDGQHYVLIARNIVEHGVYSRFIDEPFQPTSFRTPLLPLYFVPFIYLFGFDSIWLAILILIIVLSLIPIISYYLARIFVSQDKSLLIGLIVAVEPLLAYRSNFAEPDALMILLFLLSLYFLILFWKKGENKKMYLSALFLGLLTLAKPVGVYLVAIFIVFILSRLFFKDKRGSVKKIILPILLFILIFVAIIFPWLARNNVIFGVWDLSSIKAHNLYSCYTNSFNLDNEQVNFNSEDRDPIRNIKYQQQLVDISLERIKVQPFDYLKFHLTGTVRLLVSSDLQSFYYNGHSKLIPFDYNPINSINLTESMAIGDIDAVVKFVGKNLSYLLRYILFGLFYLFILWHWLRLFFRDKKTFVIFSFFLILTFYFVFAPGPFVDPKYRLPAIPLLLIIFFHTFKTNVGKKIK